MRKKIIGLVLAILVTTLCVGCGCGSTYQEATGQSSTEKQWIANGYFTVIYKWGDSLSTYYIAYANDTKVKYLLSFGDYRSGITPLYNADGSLQVYEGE